MVTLLQESSTRKRMNKSISIVRVLLIACCTFVVHGFGTSIIQNHHRNAVCLHASKQEEEQDVLEQTRQQLKQLSSPSLPSSLEEYLKLPALKLKELCRQQKLSTKGRKPDLAKRLVDAAADTATTINDDDDDDDDSLPDLIRNDDSDDFLDVQREFSFHGYPMELSQYAKMALARASFITATPIQQVAWKAILSRENVLLHAPTGSGKTLAYLLPITEKSEDSGISVVLTPTRELAAQVAGIATVLTPPGTVRFITSPCNLCNSKSDEDITKNGGRKKNVEQLQEQQPTIYIGSAKSIWISLFGDGNKGAVAPTPKPLAQKFLQQIQHLILDEVDTLLLGSSFSSKRSANKKKHEKPAAILVSMIVKYSLSNVQVIGASATVGRPLRREFARIMGLPPKDGPILLRGTTDASTESNNGSTRAVTIPSTVSHYILAASDDSTSSGAFLTTAALAVKTILSSQNKKSKILMVISKPCGLTMPNVMGALRHLLSSNDKIITPISVIDELQLNEYQNRDAMMEAHRRVMGSAGIGHSSSSSSSSTDNDDSNDRVWVVPEQSIRGLHMDSITTVIVVGKPSSPDEYLHIAGRTGRAGNKGTVLTITTHAQAASTSSWESMLQIQFEPLYEEELDTLVQ